MDKNIQMTQRNADNTGWDNLNPRTLAANVKATDGVSVEAKLADHASGLTDYSKLVPYSGATTGSANAYEIASPAITTLTAGMAVCVKINVDSNAASTLNWSGLGAKAIKKSNGVSVTNLKANGIYTLRYDGTNFILQGEGGSGNAMASDLRAGKTASTDAGDITGTFPDFIRATLANYIVKSGENITAGDLVEFINGKASLPKIKGSLSAYTNVEPTMQSASYGYDCQQLDATHFVLVCSYSGNAIAVVITVEDNVLSVGTPCTLNTVTYSNMILLKLDATTFLILLGSSLLLGILFTVSGTTITKVGSVTTLIALTYCKTIKSACAIDSSRVILCYEDGNYYIQSCIISISNNVITKNTSYAIKASSSYSGDYQVVVYDTNKALIVYTAATTGSCSGKIVSISGTELSVGSETILRSSVSRNLRMKLISPNNLIIGCTNESGLFAGNVFVVNINGASISVGNMSNYSTVFNDSDVAIIDELTAIVLFSNGSQYTTYCIIHINELVTTYDAPVIVSANVTSGPTKIHLLDKKKLVLMYIFQTSPIVLRAILGDFQNKIGGFAMQSGLADQSIQCYDWR